MRLFVAIHFPPEVRKAIDDAATTLRAATLPIRWVAKDALHLTVKFLGDVDGDVANAIAPALESAVAPMRTFPIEIQGVGAFPSPERPSIVWAGCVAAPPLELLFHAVETTLEPLGFAPEARAFHPHVTLGRVRRHARVRDLSSALQALRLETTATVRSVELMESELTANGPRYRVRHRVGLEGA